MTKRGPRTEQQFQYWHALRMGQSQADIAREYGITRQAVNKSVKLQERDVMFRLLDTAQMSGILVEWYNAGKGVLIGVTPQIWNLACILVVDQKNKIRLFYDQDGMKNRGEKERNMTELARTLKGAFGLSLEKGASFKETIKAIIGA